MRNPSKTESSQPSPTIPPTSQIVYQFLNTTLGGKSWHFKVPAASGAFKKCSIHIIDHEVLDEDQDYSYNGTELSSGDDDGPPHPRARN